MLKFLEIQPKKIDLSTFKKRSALESDCSNLIDYDCLVTVNGVSRILYCKMEGATNYLRWAVKTINYEENIRTAGLKTNSAIFGYSPRIVMRKDFCSSTAMSRNFPKQHLIICNFAQRLIPLYEYYFQDILKAHYEKSNQKIKEEWKLPGTPFTSGIVNKNNPLKYHHDSGNFKDVLSNMIVLKRGVEGGRLCCPEFDLKFECADDHVIIFDGAEILHGVTPIIKPELNENCYRYSIVYYTLEQMWKCEEINDEVKRIRKVKTGREQRRIANTSSGNEKE